MTNLTEKRYNLINSVKGEFMKQSLKTLMVCILFSLTLFAQESIEQSIQPIKVEEATISSVPTAEPISNQIEQSPSSISQLIEKIKSAKAEDRRILMNELKVQFRESNKEHRHQAILALKKAFANKESHTQMKEHMQMKMHQQSENCNPQEEQSKHQPKFRHLQHQREMENRAEMEPRGREETPTHPQNNPQNNKGANNR